METRRSPVSRSSSASASYRERSFPPHPSGRRAHHGGRGDLLLRGQRDLDPALLRELPTGSYAFAPKGRTMFGACPEGGIVQVHGIGPFHIHWLGGLSTLDDADRDTKFRYQQGQRLRCPRGSGVVQRGYRSGDVIQYEVAGERGELFLASEADCAPP